MGSTPPPPRARSHYVTLRDEAGASNSPPPSGSLARGRGDPAALSAERYYSDYEDSDGGDDVEGRSPGGAGSWWRRLLGGGPRERQETPESGYLTLIPLSDSRLRPQHTRAIIAALALLALFAVIAVYFAVPRGVTVGTIEVVNATISFNMTLATYQIVLWTQLPVYNPNYASVTVRGNIDVLFYDQRAGRTKLSPVTILPREQPGLITVDINSSSVPHKYLFTIYTQCFTFPEKLIFFLTANLTAEYLGAKYSLPRTDNYAIVDCESHDDGGGGDDREESPDEKYERVRAEALAFVRAAGGARGDGSGGMAASAGGAEWSPDPWVQPALLAGRQEDGDASETPNEMTYA